MKIFRWVMLAVWFIALLLSTAVGAAFTSAPSDKSEISRLLIACFGDWLIALCVITALAPWIVAFVDSQREGGERAAAERRATAERSRLFKTWRRGVRAVLEVLQHKIMDSSPFTPTSDYRVSLYRLDEKALELVLVARSHGEPAKPTSFKVLPDRALGVVGLALRASGAKPIIIPKRGGNEPPLPRITPQSPPADVARYASATNMSEQWVRQRASAGKRSATTFIAQVIPTHPRTVLVVDTMHETPPSIGPQFDGTLKSLQNLIRHRPPSVWPDSEVSS